MAHHAFGQDHPSCLTVRRRAEDLLAERRALFEAETPDSILEGYKAGSEAAFHYAPESEVKRDIHETFFTEGRRQYRVAFKGAFDSEDLLEELFCDLLGADLTLAINSRQHENMIQTLRGIYVGFYHLQTLAYIDRWFRGQQRGFRQAVA